MDSFEKRNKHHLLDKWDHEIDLHNSNNVANQDFQKEQNRRKEALRSHEDEQQAIQNQFHMSPSSGHSTVMSGTQKILALRNSRGSERPENYKTEENERNHTRQHQRTRERGQRTRS